MPAQHRSSFTVAAAIIVMLVLLAGAALFSMQRRVAALEAKLDLTPPITVMRLADMVSGLSKNPTEEEFAERLEQYEAKVAKLMKAGYIVLDSQAVAGAPEDYYVPAE